ncbi:ubiquitin/ISG15-conjugating enzyme E2 L6 isoform X2 [Callorhinus ursinus]|uniref:E2 ubiquitin-conjugating enzyme n=1 Tax=Callorhinus ursinus TaxID=34884 RepID=A0A3Q7PJX0_CALUR|nr:ubiquitin/ISG15-conjugating enzyme E2 L6 isoform X2 [Callorhinus ursinus]
MMASKRVAKELEDLQEKLPTYLRNLSSDDADVLVWHVLLLPEKPPYNLKAFHLRINFPKDYPFKPPTVTFTTRIYHPNVDHNGSVCLPIISRENWKPHTKTCQGATEQRCCGSWEREAWAVEGRALLLCLQTLVRSVPSQAQCTK